MTDEAKEILCAIRRLDANGQEDAAEAIANAIEMLGEVRTGTDFECECHNAARKLRLALMPCEEEEED